MPKPIMEIVENLDDMLKMSGEPVMTITWPDFYTLCDMTRFKDPRPKQIKDKASAMFHLIVDYGQNVVVVCHDRNFSPLKN